MFSKFIKKKKNIINIIILLLIGTLIIFSVTKDHFTNENENDNNNNNNEKIVVSLTTSPKRINYIKPVIDCMLTQTRTPDKIYLNLPKVFKRNNTTFDMPLPNFITQNEKIVVNFCDDIGPATKIIPAVHKETEPETYILSIDDDIYYPPYIIQLYLDMSNKFENCIITGTSFVPNNTESDKYWFNNIKQTIKPYFNGQIADLLEGYGGVLYKRKFFNSELVQNFYKNISNDGCKFGDDLNLSNLFKKHGVRIINLNMSIEYNGFDKSRISVLKYGLNEDALHNGAAGGNNNNYLKCTQYLYNNNDLYVSHFKQ